MNIIEATKQALKKGVGITNQGLNKSQYYLLPTNTNECYLIIPLGYKIGSDKKPAPRWNPKASDILREDWELHPIK